VLRLEAGVAGKTAIVIGSGAAGVSAAFRLKQAGVSVTLVERDRELGGRTKSLRIDGFTVDIGAGLLPGSYAAVYRLMNDAGVGDALAQMTSPTAISRNGTLHYLDLTQPARAILCTSLLSTRSKLKLGKIGLRALRMWSSLGFDKINGAAQFDTETIEQYTRRALGEETYEYLINPTEKLMYTVPSAEASVIDLFWVAKNLFHPKAYCVKGGMDRLISGVAKHFEVRAGTEVLRVEGGADNVRVTTRDAAGRESIETFDLCVIATPARDAATIDAGLSADSRQFLAELHYSTLTDLHLRLKSRPTEKAVLVMIPDEVDRDLAGILMDHNKGEDRAPPGKGAVTGYFMDPWAQKAYPLSDEEIFRRGIDKMERAMPGLAALVEGYHVQRWDYAATVSYPGYYKELSTFIEGLDFNRRVQLAGDYFSMASVNTAVTSGEIAARRLVERYLQS
jgi:oxygen-dependent protoporphyrinogen oxidase